MMMVGFAVLALCWWVLRVLPLGGEDLWTSIIVFWVMVLGFLAVTAIVLDLTT